MAKFPSLSPDLPQPWHRLEAGRWTDTEDKASTSPPLESLGQFPFCLLDLQETPHTKYWERPTHHSVICRLFFPLFFHSYRCFQKHFRPFFFLVTCSINVFINNFTDIQFPDHTVYPFKVYNSVVLKIFTNLCNHLCIPTPEHIHHPKKKPPACQ